MKKAFLFSTLVLLMISCNKEDTPQYISVVLPPPVDYFESGSYQGHFTLFWDHQYKSSLNYYIIERFPGDTKDTADAFATQYEIPGFVVDTNYYFIIRAVDKGGTYSESKSLTVGNY